MGTIITIGALIVLVIIAINLIRAIISRVRALGNYFQSSFGNDSSLGNDSSRIDEARNILNNASKNGLILKWATEDALKTVMKYYDQDSAVDYVTSYLRQNGLKRVDVPRSFYKQPGCTKEELCSICNSYFSKFDFKAMDKDGAMTERDFSTFNNLAYMWYFADNSIRSIEDAHKAVQDTFGEFCENNANKVIG